jgi:hypothetical protein
VIAFHFMGQRLPLEAVLERSPVVGYPGISGKSFASDRTGYRRLSIGGRAK